MTVHSLPMKSRKRLARDGNDAVATDSGLVEQTTAGKNDCTQGHTSRLSNAAI